MKYILGQIALSHLYVLGVFQSYPLCVELSNFLPYVLKMDKLLPTSNFMLTLSTLMAN
jgi:hypothetical protein